MQPKKYFALIALLSIYETTCAPITTSEIRKRSVISESLYTPNLVQNNAKQVKKDVFLSRGWGAGGMPFSVLYLNPYSSKNTGTQQQQSREPYKTLPVASRKEKQRAKSLPQVRNSMGSGRRKQYSIIPQLFVSYGWGPLGKGK